jgi:hypothetical protein
MLYVNKLLARFQRLHTSSEFPHWHRLATFSALLTGMMAGGGSGAPKEGAMFTLRYKGGERNESKMILGRR